MTGDEGDRRGVRVWAGLALLVALWAAAAVPAVRAAVEVVSARAAANDLGRPIGAVVLALEAERRLSVTRPAAGAQSAESATAQSADQQLAAQRKRTDTEIAELRAAGDRWWYGVTGPDAARSADDLLDRTNRLAALRTAVDAGRMDSGAVVGAYTAIADGPGAGTPTVQPDRQTGSAAGLVALSRTRELLALEDALLAATPPGERLTERDRTRLAELAGARRASFTDAASGLPTAAAARYRALAGDSRLAAVRTMENTLILGSRPAPAPADWTAAFNPVNVALWELQESAAREAAEASTPDAVKKIVWAGLLGGVGLIAVITMLVLTRRQARGQQPGGRRKRQDPADRDAGRTRQRLDGVLLDLDRRNQSLLHRQLRLLDSLSRRESDEQALADLFRADHLANRMRRNLEKATALTGGNPARRWRRPVPMGEIVRAAASEVAEYTRVSTSQVEPALLAGVAVTDLMHLLAELIENATTFAPAQSRVRVTGAHDVDGYVVTVTDLGPGMTEDDLATAHQVMADPEPSASGTWWGLFAVGRFAERQDLTVHLHNGPDGGLVAEVTVPATLIQAGVETEETLDETSEPVSAS